MSSPIFPTLRKSIVPTRILAARPIPSISTRAYYRTPSLAVPSRPTPRILPTATALSLPQTAAPKSLRFKNTASGSGDGEFRKWGFEDISSSLPSDSPSPSSPTQKPVILIDVREPSELHSTGIIPSAISLPLKTQPDALFLPPDEFETRFGFPKPSAESTPDGPEKEGQMVFYCRAGVRAKTAAELAARAGYDRNRIGVYEGSWLDWEARKGRVVRWDGGYE